MNDPAADKPPLASDLQSIHNAALMMAQFVGDFVDAANGIDVARRVIDPLYQDQVVYAESGRPLKSLFEHPAAAAVQCARYRQICDFVKSLTRYPNQCQEFASASDGASIREGCGGFYGPSWHDVAFHLFAAMGRLFEFSTAQQPVQVGAGPNRWPGNLFPAIRSEIKTFEWRRLQAILRDEYSRLLAAVGNNSAAPQETDSARSVVAIDPELGAVYTAGITDEDEAHKLCLLLALRAWRLISIAHGDDAPLDKRHPFGDSHLHQAMLDEGSVADSTSLFGTAVSDFRNACAAIAIMLKRHGGALPINVLADGTALKEGCTGRFGETWHHVAVQLAFNLLGIVDAAVPRQKILVHEKAAERILAAMPDRVKPKVVVITSEMRTKVYEAIKRARFTVFNVEQLQARMEAERRRASSFESQMNAKNAAATNPNAADNAKKSGPALPDNKDVLDLCALLAKRQKTGKSLNQIAREFTQGNIPKANSLLRQARRYRHLWE